jgi:hypothetical protein
MKKIILILALVFNLSAYSQETSSSSGGSSPSIFGLGLGDDYFFVQYETFFNPHFSVLANHTYFMEVNEDSDNLDTFLWNITGVGGRLYFSQIFKDGFNVGAFAKLARNGTGLDEEKNYFIFTALPAYAWFWGTFGINLGLEWVLVGPKPDIKYKDGDGETQKYTAQREPINDGQIALNLSFMIAF